MMKRSVRLATDTGPEARSCRGTSKVTSRMKESAEHTDEQSRIEAIRDILFGRQMQEYTQRFEALEARLKADLQATTEQLQHSQAQDTEQLRAEMTQQRAELISSFTDQLDQLQGDSIGRRELAQALRDIADRFDGR